MVQKVTEKNRKDHRTMQAFDIHQHATAVDTPSTTVNYMSLTCRMTCNWHDWQSFDTSGSPATTAWHRHFRHTTGKKNKPVRDTTFLRKTAFSPYSPRKTEKKHIGAKPVWRLHILTMHRKRNILFLKKKATVRTHVPTNVSGSQKYKKREDSRSVSPLEKRE